MLLLTSISPYNERSFITRKIVEIAFPEARQVYLIMDHMLGSLNSFLSGFQMCSHLVYIYICVCIYASLVDPHYAAS